MMLKGNEIISHLPLPIRAATLFDGLGIRTVDEARAVLLYADPKFLSVVPNFGVISLRRTRDILFADIQEDDWSAEQAHRGEIRAYHVFNALTMKAVERKWKAGNKIEVLAAALQTHSASVIGGLRCGGWISPESGPDSSGRRMDPWWTYTVSKDHWVKPLMKDRRENLKLAFA